jgi:nucleoid-associated protein EbfC
VPDRFGGIIVEPGGQLDFQQLLAAAAQMQNQLMNAEQELAETTVEGSAGGGLVTAVVSGQGELLDLTIAPETIDSGDPAETAQTIADLVLAAIRDASHGVSLLQDERRQEAMGPLASGLGGEGGIPGLPGMPPIPGMPSLPGFPGPGQGGAGQGGASQGGASGDSPSQGEDPADGRPGEQ